MVMRGKVLPENDVWYLDAIEEAIRFGCGISILSRSMGGLCKDLARGHAIARGRNSIKNATSGRKDWG